MHLRGFSTVLTSLYDAVPSDENWANALENMRRFADLRGMTLAAADTVGLPYRLRSWSENYGTDNILGYFSRWGHHDEEAWARIAREGVAGQLTRDIDLWPDRDVQENRGDFVELREHFGIWQRGCMPLNRDKGWTDLLSVQLSCRWDELPEDFEETIQLCVPHYAKALELNRQFSLLRQRHNAVFAALDHFCVGLALGDRFGRLVLTNREAERIFSLRDGIHLSPSGEIVATEEDYTRRVRAALEATSTTAQGEADCCERTIVCRRRSGADPFVISATPLRDREGEFERSFAGCLVTIMDPGHTPEIDISGLTKVFSLTQSEAVVCHALVQGRCIDDIADLRGVSRETVRAQVKSIYAKTGASNRVELIRRAIAIHPPIL